jgi:N-terminal domain of galactosyltransferase/N-terminal region of glycosyl transferase group 7
MTDKKFCFIVPYRDRAEHLAKFVPHYKGIFPDVPIFVIEQHDNKPFNRGKLLNVGTLIHGLDFDYFCLSDVDMYVVPETADYSYPKNPTHLAAQCSQFGYKMPYNDYFGGVNLFSNDQFTSVNGFSNCMWGWGAEDDLLLRDFLRLKYTIERRQCRFECADHPRHMNQVLYRRNLNLLTRGRLERDGLIDCTYSITSTEFNENYTLIKVKL